MYSTLFTIGNFNTYNDILYAICIKRSPLGERKSGLIRQVTSLKRLNSYEVLSGSTIKRCPFNTGDCLIEMTAWACLTVLYSFYVLRVVKHWLQPHLDLLCQICIFLFSSTFRRKQVELLSSLRRQRQRLGRLSFRLSPFLKNYHRYPFETWNTCSLSKKEPITTRQMTLWCVYPELSVLVST